MAWTEPQIKRLGIEKQLLDKYFKKDKVTWISPLYATKVEVEMEANNGKKYILRVYIPGDYPNSCPRLVIVSPKNLSMRNGAPLPESESAFHTLDKLDGCLSICHFFPPRWGQENTLYQVFMKGRLWIEAYEGHLSTGQNIDVYLPEQVGAEEVLLHVLLGQLFQR